LIDNASTDGTPELLLEQGYIKQLPPGDLEVPYEQEYEIKNGNDDQLIKVHYVRMHENTGGAGGFYEGVKRGYEKGYDWLWLMDDDAEPKVNALGKLAEHFHARNISALASTVVSSKGEIDYQHRGFIDYEAIFPTLQKPLPSEAYGQAVVEIDMASFVGILIKSESVGEVGYPKSEFFIHHDDVEYCIRLQRAGKLLLIPESRVVHRYESTQHSIPKFIFGKAFPRRPFDRFQTKYYGMRNLVWIGKKYSTHKKKFYCDLVMNFLKAICGILIFDDHKFRRMVLTLHAYRDGLRGTFDAPLFVGHHLGDEKTLAVILNWNQGEMTCRCLDALLDGGWSGPVCVVDNGSSDATREVLRDYAQSHHQVRLIEFTENMGFAKAVNRAVAISGEGINYLLILNNDAFVKKGAMQYLLQVMAADATIGIAGPKIMQRGAGHRIDSAGCRGIVPLAQPFMRGHGEVDAGQYDRMEDVEYLSGACMMVRGDSFREVGGFDEDFYMYFEDWDLCRRIRRRGKRCVYLPSAVAEHVGSASSGDRTPFYHYHHARSRILFARKHLSMPVFVCSFLPYFVLYRFLWQSIRLISRGGWSAAAAIWKGVAWNMRHAPTLRRGVK